MYVYIYIYILCEEFFLPPTRQTSFPYNAVISSASPRCQHLTWFLSLPLDCSTLLFFLPCLFSFLLYPLLFQQYISISNNRPTASTPLFHFSALRLWLPRGAVATARIKAFQLHLQSQKKNEPVWFCSTQWWEEKVNRGQFLVLISCTTKNVSLTTYLITRSHSLTLKSHDENVRYPTCFILYSSKNGREKYKWDYNNKTYLQKCWFKENLCFKVKEYKASSSS